MLQLPLSEIQISNTPNKLDTKALQKRIHKNIDNQWLAQCRGLTLSSAFQPIISLNHRRVVGHEALLRTHNANNKNISPAVLFNSREDIEQVIELDRLCRVLHSANYQQQSSPNEWLFLNINPEVINHGHLYGDFFSNLLHSFGLEPSQIVVEVMENRVTDEALLYERIEYYRNMGCLIAIDDFGAGHSNIDRVLYLEPEIVKLDRNLVFNVTSCKAKRILNNLVALLHEAGCLVVLEGIETLEQAQLAYEVDADLVQGFLFSRPAASVIRNLDDTLFSDILKQVEQQQHKSCTSRNATLSHYLNTFQQSVYNYESGIAFQHASKNLLDIEGVQRTYLMNETGYLIDDNLYSKTFEKKLRPQMAPMHHSSGANLSSRHYFRRAKNNIGKTQVTRPYLSITDAELCITLSQCVVINGEKQVVCCDLSVPENM